VRREDLRVGQKSEERVVLGEWRRQHAECTAHLPVSRMLRRRQQRRRSQMACPLRKRRWKRQTSRSSSLKAITRCLPQFRTPVHQNLSTPPQTSAHWSLHCSFPPCRNVRRVKLCWPLFSTSPHQSLPTATHPPKRTQTLQCPVPPAPILASSRPPPLP